MHEIPRERVVALSGSAWIDFLVRTCPSIKREQMGMAGRCIPVAAKGKCPDRNSSPLDCCASIDGG
jgi:hypothetical protein